MKDQQRFRQEANVGVAKEKVAAMLEDAGITAGRPDSMSNLTVLQVRASQNRSSFQLAQGCPGSP